MARPLSRRDVLSRGALLALGGPALLAACSSGDKKDSGSSTDASASGSSGSDGSDKKVRIATWPYYLEDDNNPQASPTVKSFTKATGYGVDYKLAVDDNSSFTTKYQPDLEKGNGIGFDVVVLTSWMASRWVQRGWAQAFTADGIPNKGNILDRMAVQTVNKAPEHRNVRDYVADVNAAHRAGRWTVGPATPLADLDADWPANDISHHDV